MGWYFQDLTDKLWDICEHRMKQAKEEQKRIAEDHWLEDHTGLQSNHYISLMQVGVITCRYADSM